MTSQRFWADMQKENIKRRLWPIALSVLGSFFALTVVGVLAIGIWEERLYMNSMRVRDITNAFAFEVLGTGNIATVLLVIGMAMVNAIQGFHYLQDARGTDLYGSLPIKRDTLFGVVVFNGFIIFAVPFIVFHIVTLFIGLGKGYVNGHSFVYSLLSLFGIFAMYLLTYMISVLAVMLTGHWIVAILGTVVLFGVFPFMSLSIDAYMSEFFMTYYEYFGEADGILDFLKYCSPVWLYTELISRVELIEGTGMVPVLEYGPKGIILTVIILAAAVALFFVCRKLVMIRKGESAGHSMAFAKTKPFIKVLMLVPASLVSGLLFYEIANLRLGWLFFGIIACLIIGHGIIEIIYESDFKAAFKGRGSLLVSAVVTGLILFMVFFDPLGYEAARPAASKVAEMAVYDGNLFSNISYRTENSYGGYDYMDSMTFVKENMHLENSAELEKLIDKGASYARKNHFKAILHNNDSYDYTQQAEKDGSEHNYHSVCVIWKLKNGKNIIRRYYIDMKDDESFDLMSELFSQPAFKEGVLQGLTTDPAKISWFSLQNYLLEAEGDHELTPDESRALMSAYKNDVSRMELSELRSDLPSVLLHVGTMDKPVNGNKVYNTVATLPVYPSYKETIKWLESHGIEATWYTGYEDFDSLTIETERSYYYDSAIESVMNIDGKENVKKIMDAAIPAELWNMGAGYLDAGLGDDLVYVFLNFGRHQDYISEFVLQKSKLPADVRDEIERLSEESDFGG